MIPTPRIIEAIVAQHAEEAAFQWLLRNDAIGAPHYSLSDLAHLDDRIAAHLDGLRLAGDAGWEICRRELQWQEPGELFTASVLAFESGQTAHIEAVAEAAAESPAAAPGLASALAWLPYETARPHLEKLLQSEVPLLRRLGLAVAALHRAERHYADFGPTLESALREVDPTVTPRALRAAGELGRLELLSPCQALLTSDNNEIRFWAAWATTVLGDKTATSMLTAIASEGGPRAEYACTTAVRAMAPKQARHWQRQLVDQTDNRRLAVLAAGACGDPQLIPWLIETMSVDEQARVAGEAFTLITGVDLAFNDLQRDQPEDFQAGPTEDPADEDVALDADEDLAWPDADLVLAWWETNGRHFKPGQRHLAGLAVAEQTLQSVLRTGLQRQRIAAALELVLLKPGRPLFEVRARGDRQTQLLES